MHSHLPPPSWCCQRCRAEIGWIDRGLETVFGPLGYAAHDCLQARSSVFELLSAHARAIHRLTVMAFWYSPKRGA